MSSTEDNNGSESSKRIYRENPKHKPGAFGGGQPRWFPDHDTPCPRDITTEMAQELLKDAVFADDPAQGGSKALYSMDSQGRFFKAYRHFMQGEEEHWHGFPVNDERVCREIPAKVLRKFMNNKNKGKWLPKSRYKKLLRGY